MSNNPSEANQPSTPPASGKTPPISPPQQEAGKGGLAAFVETMKPYKELIAMLVTGVAALSGAIAWIVAYFATQTAVNQLECRLSHQIASSQHETRARALEAGIDARQSLVKIPANQKLIKPLMEEVADLTSKAGKERDASNDEMTQSADCKNTK